MQKIWKTYNFSELFDISSGLSKSRDQFGFGHPFVTFKNVFYNFFLPNELGELANTNEKERISGSVLKGDIFLTRTSETLHELGMSSVALKDYPNATFNGFCKRLRIKKDATIQVDPVFIGYFLRSHFFRNEVTKHATMTTRASLNSTAIKTLQVTLPPFEEQRAIGQVLKPLDDKIELNLQTNKTLEEMAITLYKHWFVDFGPFRDGNFVDSELGLIPEGWEVKKIGQIVKIIGGFAFKSKDFQDEGETVIKIKNISNNVVSIEGSDCISIEIAQKTNPKFKIRPGSFLIAMTGAEVGKVGIVPDYGKSLWLNQRVGMISEPKFQNAEILIGNLLQSEASYEIIQNLAYGSAQPNISTSGIEDILFPMPDDDSVLNDLLNKIGNWHDQRILNFNETITLTALRESLLPKLISGEVRVRDAEKLLTDAL